MSTQATLKSFGVLGKSISRYWCLATLFLTCASCENSVEPTSSLRQSILSASACNVPGPRPTDSWDIATCWWEHDRPSGADHVAGWVTAATGTGGEPPPYPQMEVAWIAVLGKTDGKETVGLYITPDGANGLDSPGQWAHRSSPMGWFSPSSTVPLPILPGEVATITMNRPYDFDIAHGWKSQIIVPPDIHNVWVEAKVRLTGDVRLQVGFDWYSGTSRLLEGATSYFVGGEKCSDWVIIASPRRDEMPRSCDPSWYLPGTMPPPPPPPSPPPSWRLRFTAAKTPVTGMTAYRKGGAWESLPVTDEGSNQYRIDWPDFLPSDTLVISWSSSGTTYWGCEGIAGTYRILAPLTATGPDGKSYNGYAVPNGMGGCDIGIR